MLSDSDVGIRDAATQLGDKVTVAVQGVVHELTSLI